MGGAAVRYPYGYWPELERIEIGDRAAFTYDETSTLMHRMIRAVGGVYDIAHNYWGRGAA